MLLANENVIYSNYFHHFSLFNFRVYWLDG